MVARSRHRAPARPLPASYPRHRFPAEIISHAVWLYHIFRLSLRAGGSAASDGRAFPSRVSVRLWQ
jgi:putative transposase